MNAIDAAARLLANHMRAVAKTGVITTPAAFAGNVLRGDVGPEAASALMDAFAFDERNKPILDFDLETLVARIADWLVRGRCEDAIGDYDPDADDDDLDMPFLITGPVRNGGRADVFGGHSQAAGRALAT